MGLVVLCKLGASLLLARSRHNRLGPGITELMVSSEFWYKNVNFFAKTGETDTVGCQTSVVILDMK
jgi:hypothetical protein